MDKFLKTKIIRTKLSSGKVCMGSWQMIGSPEISECLGRAGYDWINVDLEHGSIAPHELPNIFRALELGDTLPLARITLPDPMQAKQVMEAGAGGVIIPDVRNRKQLEDVKAAIAWAPAGERGVGYDRANCYGLDFNQYKNGLSQKPLIIPMIEHIDAIENLRDILSIEVDAVMIGPYDLSSSLGITGEFENPLFKKTLNIFSNITREMNIPTGYHIIGSQYTKDPYIELQEKLLDGYRFIAYSGDVMLLNKHCKNPYSK
tara:strand:+ start:509 stop:1288 length:780 start_codon:yes stop_codon:yes gene_type:complete